MAYADSEDKQRGIAREPFVAQRILDYFESMGMKVKMEKSSLNEDMRKKFDYKYTCNENQSFANNGKVHEIKVDIKCAKTFTLIDELGRNTLENSESTFLVYEMQPGADLLWVNTGKFKECLDRNGYELRKSKINNSKYFFIEDYIRKNQKFLGKFVKYIK
jgi:hypothetical protein